jgi:hypothetical protein
MRSTGALEMLSLVILPAEEALPTRPDLSQPDVNVWSSPEGALCAFSHSQGERHWLHWPGVARFSFSAGSDAVTAVPYVPARYDLIKTTFHHSVLPLVLQALGREGLHSSSVLTTKGVVGFCGKAHTGKSTTAYAMSKRGFPLWSDDALVWEEDRGGFRAVALPFEPKLRPPALSFFGHGSPAEVQGAQIKASDRTAPLAAVCVLARTTAGSGEPLIAVKRLTGGRALATLLDHAHCFSPSNTARTRRMMMNYLSLLDRVPVFEVRFEPSFSRIFQLVEAIVESVVEG